LTFFLPECSDCTDCDYCGIQAGRNFAIGIEGEFNQSIFSHSLLLFSQLKVHSFEKWKTRHPNFRFLENFLFEAVLIVSSKK